MQQRLSLLPQRALLCRAVRHRSSGQSEQGSSTHYWVLHIWNVTDTQLFSFFSSGCVSNWRDFFYYFIRLFIISFGLWLNYSQHWYTCKKYFVFLINVSGQKYLLTAFWYLKSFNRFATSRRLPWRGIGALVLRWFPHPLNHLATTRRRVHCKLETSKHQLPASGKLIVEVLWIRDIGEDYTPIFCTLVKKT